METVQNSMASVEHFKQAEAARVELQTLQSRLRAYLTELMLPPSWTFEIPEVDIHRPSGPQQLSNANGYNICSTELPSNMRLNAMDTTCNWTPGQTTMGEEILGYRPYTTTGILASTGKPGQILINIRFVIERKGEPNPIAIVDAPRVGYPAVDAYLGLPEERRCNIAHIDRQYKRSDDDKVVNITGVARDPTAATCSRLPWTVVQIEYDGQPRLLNRSGLRFVKGDAKADIMINKFLHSVGEELDALMD